MRDIVEKTSFYPWRKSSVLWLIIVSSLSICSGVIPRFEGIECGLSRSRDIQSELGRPVMALSSATYVERFVCSKHGIVTADVAYNDHGPVCWARIRFVKKMPPSTVALIFWQADTPRIQKQGNRVLHHYDASGVHLEIQNKTVTQAWMTLPEADWADIAAEAAILLRSLDRQTQVEPPVPVVPHPPAAPTPAIVAPPRSQPPPTPSTPTLAPAPPKTPGLPLKITVTNKPGGSIRIHQVTIKETTNPKSGKGITISLKATATDKANAFVTALAQFRHPQGDYVAAGGPQPERWQNQDGAFMASTQMFCSRDQMNWDALTISIPYRQLRLASGPHSLILDLSLRSGSSQNSIAQPLQLTIPEKP